MKATLLFFLFSFAIGAFTENQFLGQWRLDDPAGVSSIIVFKADKTFAGQLLYHQKVVWEFSGRWSFDGSLINYEYTQSSSPRVPVGFKDRDIVKDVGKDFFVIEDADGQVRRYSRLPKE